MPSQNDHNKPGALQYIRTIYLSLAAIIGLTCFIIGASGAVKLVINVWYPVNNYAPVTMPYEQSGCEVSWSPDGKQQIVHTPQEVADCNAKIELQNQQQQQNDFNRQLSESVSLTLVGLPIWLLHFWLIQLDWKKARKKV